MQRAASSKIVVLVSCSSVALLITSSLVSSSNDLERDRETEFLNGQIAWFQNCLRSNASRIANLTAQITDMNSEIFELRLALDRKTAENSKLEKKALDLSKAFSDLKGQLDCLEKSEQMYLLADRLRNPAYPSGDGS